MPTKRNTYGATRGFGDGMEAGVTMGPVISAAHKEKVLAYIERGLKEGAELLVDGREKGNERREAFDVGEELVIARPTEP